jgi:3-oxoacyl-[acyl-carrier protein] reductase
MQLDQPNERPELTGKTVVVTGGGQGLGRAYCLRFARMGYQVAVLDINFSGAQKVASQIEAQGGSCIAVEVDIGDEKSVAMAVAEVESRFGGIDILINNAAIFSTLNMRPFEEIPLDEWNHVMNANITGTFLMVRAVSPIMRKQRWGRVINISSAVMAMGRPHYLHYTTSKAAIIGMTRSMARELGSHDITINAVLPGATDTEIERATVTPAQKQAQIAMRSIQREETTDDVTGVVVFLASHDSRFISGQSLIVDGGLNFI